VQIGQTDKRAAVYRCGCLEHTTAALHVAAAVVAFIAIIETLLSTDLGWQPRHFPRHRSPTSKSAVLSLYHLSVCPIGAVSPPHTAAVCLLLSARRRRF